MIVGMMIIIIIMRIRCSSFSLPTYHLYMAAKSVALSGIFIFISSFLAKETIIQDRISFNCRSEPNKGVDTSSGTLDTAEDIYTERRNFFTLSFFMF